MAAFERRGDISGQVGLDGDDSLFAGNDRGRGWHLKEVDDGYLMMSSRVVVNRSLVAVRGQWRASCFGHCYVVAQEGGCIGERGMDGVSR